MVLNLEENGRAIQPGRNSDGDIDWQVDRFTLSVLFLVALTCEQLLDF